VTHRILRGFAVLVAVPALLLGMASLTLANVVERDRYSFSDSFTDEDCGITVDVAVEASGVLMIRQDKPGSTAFLLSNVFQFREVITNSENGKSMVIRGKGNFREVRATHVEGDIYRFRAQLAGQPFVIESAAGDVVYRERGLLVFDVLFDTFGDDEPGGEEISFDVVGVRGYPGFIDDLCPLVTELIG
jgi:hypothetical protein